MKLTAFIPLLISIVAISGESVDFKNCNIAEVGHATKLELTPCPSQPCEFERGQTVDVKISFIASFNSSDLKAAIYGYVAGIPVPWSMPNPNGCKDSGISCPIVTGQAYTYHASFQVLDTYPLIRLVVMWRLDGDGKNAFCVTFPMAIVKSKSGMIIG